MSTENENESKYYDLHEDTLEVIQTIIDKMALPFNIKIKFLGNSKLKTLCKLQKINDIFSHITGIDLIIFINEDYFISFDENKAEILIYQELDRLEFDLNKGTFKIAQYPLQTTIGVLKKYGIDAVAEANQLIELYSQQKLEADQEAAEELKNSLKDKVKSVKKDVEFLN